MIPFLVVNLKYLSTCPQVLFLIHKKSHDIEEINIVLKQKSIPIFFTEKRKASHWNTKFTLVLLHPELNSGTTQRRINCQKKP